VQGIVDVLNLFPQVGALLIVGLPNDVGFPVGIVAFCSGTLIHERACSMRPIQESPTSASVASDGGIDRLKPDYRARVDTAVVRRWIDEILQQHLSRVR
jgi:hypothetical protein